MNSPKSSNEQNDSEIEINYSQSPTVPFARLHREIGTSYQGGVYSELTDARQQTIYNWVDGISQPYDMIQRAEGWATPEKVYNGAQQRALKHSTLSKKENAVLRGKAGRAAIRRHYRRTYEHYDIASDRLSAGKLILRHLTKGQVFDADDSTMLEEILQELANGVAANLDRKFPGGNEYARKAGISILRVIPDAVDIEKIPIEYTVLISAGVNFVGKQTTGWKKALEKSEEFAKQKNFPLTREEPDAQV